MPAPPAVNCAAAAAMFERQEKHMPYAIMRAEKLKTFGNVAASLQHCFRERETPNADAARTPDNVHHAARSTDEAMGKLRELLPEKRRKDAVLAVEYVMTASPEWWKTASQQQQQAFFEQARKWLADKYGQENIFAATVHHDETTPHLSAFVVPLTRNGRLSAKEFIGDRRQMSADQTSFAAAVQHLGLERGIPGSRATHQTIREYYSGLNQAQQATEAIEITAEEVRPRVLKKGFLSREEESAEAVAERITLGVKEKIKEMAVKASRSAQDGRSLEDLREGIKKIQTQSGGILEALATIPQNQLRQVQGFIAQLQRENQAEIERKRNEIKERQAAKAARKGKFTR